MKKKKITQVFERAEKCGNIKNTNLYQYNILCWDMPVWNKIIKRKFLEENNIRFHDKNIIHEDNLFMIEAYCKAKNIGILNDYTYCWRSRERKTSITQNKYLDNGENLYEMIYLVNEFLKENIHDNILLNKKYEKLLTLDLFEFVLFINKASEENLNVLFEYLYNIVSLVPQEYIDNLNSHLKTLYYMVISKDWENFMLISSDKYKINPELPENLDSKYIDEIDFQKDSHYQELISNANNVESTEEFIIIDYHAYVPYNKQNNFNKISFKLINNANEDIILDSKYIKNNKLYIPINLINFGENNIMTSYYYDNLLKENYLKTNFSKTLFFDNYDITIKRGKISNLRLIKREKNNIEIKITNIELYDDQFHLEGFSNEKINNILINDDFDFAKFLYPVEYLSESEDNKFIVKINYVDFLKSPIKKWKISSADTFNKINLTKKYEFVNNNYIIKITNKENKINIEFELYEPLEIIRELTMQNKILTEKNNKLNKNNNGLIHNTNEVINSLIKLSEKTDCLIKKSYSNESFYDEGILKNNNNFWHKIGENIVVTLDEEGTILTNETNCTTLYFANKENSQLCWANTFNWKVPFIVEVNILSYSGNVAFRITDENLEEKTIPLVDLGITRNNHVKIINDGLSIHFYRDDVRINDEKIYKRTEKCQIGFRIVNGHIKYNNFKIY